MMGRTMLVHDRLRSDFVLCLEPPGLGQKQDKGEISPKFCLQNSSIRAA